MCTCCHPHKQCMGTGDDPAKFGGMHCTQSQPNAMHAHREFTVTGLLWHHGCTMDSWDTHQIDHSGTPCHSHDRAMITSNAPAKNDGIQCTQTQPNASACSTLHAWTRPSAAPWVDEIRTRHTSHQRVVTPITIPWPLAMILRSWVACSAAFELPDSTGVLLVWQKAAVFRGDYRQLDSWPRLMLRSEDLKKVIINNTQ